MLLSSITLFDFFNIVETEVFLNLYLLFYYRYRVSSPTITHGFVSVENFHGAAMKINGSVLMRITTVKRFWRAKFGWVMAVHGG